MKVRSVSRAVLGRTILVPEDRTKISISVSPFSLTIGVDDVLARSVDPAQVVPGPLREAHPKLAGVTW